MMAAIRGWLEVARLLLDNDADPSRQSGGDASQGGILGVNLSALIYASAWGHAEIVQLLLNRGANINMVDGRGRGALFEASYWGRWDIVQLLLERGANPQIQDDRGYAALHGVTHDRGARLWCGAVSVCPVASASAEQSWAKVVSVLLSAGVDVNARLTSAPRYSPMDEMVRRNYADFAAMLRDAGGKCFVQTGPLCGDVHVAVGFSSSGSGTVSAEGDGDALSDGDEVRQGATVVFTATPATGHYVSGWSGNCAEVGGVADGLDGTAKSCAAAADSDLSVRAEFSEIPSLAGPLCPSESLSANGLTQAQLDAGLISAAKANNLTNACEYLRRGANIEAEDAPVRHWGDDVIERTPLVIAAVYGRLELARLLLNNGANVDWQSARQRPVREYDIVAGWSALALAAGAGHRDVVELLLDQGADIDIRWDYGRTALHEAAIFGRASVVELLIARGAALEVRDLSGETALHGAAWGASSGHHLTSSPTREAKWDQVLDLLLAADAEVNSRSTQTSDWGHGGRVFVNEGWNGGWTPLDRAVAANKRSRAMKLRSHGGVCNVQSGPLCPPSSVAVGFSSSGSGTVSAEGDGGALSDGGDVRQGATVTFTATPAAGHYVSGWSGNCAEVGEVADGLDGTGEVLRCCGGFCFERSRGVFGDSVFGGAVVPVRLAFGERG